MIQSYTKIFSIGTKYISDIFENEVEVTEKIDGSQFGFGKINGELHLRSKGAKIFPETAPDLFKPAVEYILSIQDKIPDNTIYHAETLSKAKHNVLEYERIPKNHLVLFSVSDIEKNFDENFQKHADLLGIDAVPVIFRGKIENSEQLFEMIDSESFLGGTKMEGVVVKNYKRPCFIGGKAFPLTAGKYVSEKFKEVHEKNWKKDFNSKTKQQIFFESFCTEARFQKAVQHLKERDELENSPKDIGKLLKEVTTDLDEEEKENVKEWLWNEYRNNLMRTAVKGFPEWYKRRLAENAFLKKYHEKF